MGSVSWPIQIVGTATQSPCDPQCWLSWFSHSSRLPVTYLWCSLTTARTSSERWRESSENLKSSLSCALRSSTWDSSPARVFLTPCRRQTQNTRNVNSSPNSSESQLWESELERLTTDSYKTSQSAERTQCLQTWDDCGVKYRINTNTVIQLNWNEMDSMSEVTVTPTGFPYRVFWTPSWSSEWVTNKIKLVFDAL